MASTVTRKIAESKISELISEGLGTNLFFESQFMQALLLISDVAREISTLVDHLIETGLIEAFLEQLIKPLSRALPNFHLIIYFINMLCMSKKGIELKKKYEMFSRVFKLFDSESFTGSSKFLEFANDFGKEIGEMVVTVHEYREPAIDFNHGCLEKSS